MRYIVVAVRAVCFVVGVLLLGFALLGLCELIQHSQETTHIGTGAYAVDVPRETIFHEMDVSLYGIWGGVLIGASAMCEVALRVMRIQDDMAVGLVQMARQQPAATPTTSASAFPIPIKEEDQTAADWLDESTPHMLNAEAMAGTPMNGKIKVKCDMCGKSVKGGADWAGRKGSCPYCKAPIQFPELAVV